MVKMLIYNEKIFLAKVLTSVVFWCIFAACLV